MPNTKDGLVTATARVFWRTRQFWLMMLLIVSSCILVGYLIGNWTATRSARIVIEQQERAYREAGDARKAVLQQCLTTNAENSKRLAELAKDATE